VVLLFVGLFVLMITAIAGTFVAVVARRYQREVARRGSWSDLAIRLGLSHQMGDPLELAERLGVTRVTQTLWGVVDGTRVAAITLTIFRPGGSPLGAGPTISSFSGAVAQLDPPASFDVDQVKAWLGTGEQVQISPTGDLVLLIPVRQGWGSLHDPADAATAEQLLRRAAWVARASEAAGR
jgi:hypothetical protein